ncbi:MAG: hypothetical protein ACE5HC_12305 [Candidatus Binatia bacterium]
MNFRVLNFKTTLGRPSILTLVLALFLSSGCGTKAVPEPRYFPAAGLLDIINDFQRLSRNDLYRFTIPKDVTGINIMKATLVRLADYEKKNPGRFSDIIDFNKAMAYERLRDYHRAIVYYRKVTDSNGPLSTQAEKNIKTLNSFDRILQKPLPTKDPFAYMKELDEKVAAWNQLIQQHEGTFYEYLARVEEEKIDRAKVTFVELNRYRLKDGNQLVILGYSQLVSKHRHSKNIYRYLVDFGDFYLRLAKEYSLQNDPEGLAFNPDTFDRLANSALKLYTEVAQVDGILEKIEARGKIEALRGLMQKTRRLNR